MNRRMLTSFLGMVVFSAAAGGWFLYREYEVEEVSRDVAKQAEIQAVLSGSRFFLASIKMRSQLDYDTITSKPFKYIDLLETYKNLTGIEATLHESRNLFDYEIAVDPTGNIVISIETFKK